MDSYLEYYQQGIENCNNGNFEAGIMAFDHALSIHPSHLESIYSRAKAKLSLQKLDECLADLSLAVKIAPDNPLLYSERAVVLYHKGLIKKALIDLDYAVQLDPENPYRYSSRAYIKDKAGDFKGAIADYEKAVALDPEDAIAYNNKGLVEEKLGFEHQSKISFSKADALTGRKNSDSPRVENKDVEASPKKTPRFSLKAYFQESKKIFTSKQGFRDFLSFVIDLVKGQRRIN